MYAVFSTTASDKASLSFSIPSSLKAWIKFLSLELCIYILESHVLNLCIIERIDSSIFCPLASLLVLPITVTSPISYLAREVGAPLGRLLLLTSSGRLMSSTLSDNTIPQLLQITSPDSGSVTSLSFLSHIEHKICVSVEGGIFLFSKLLTF